MSYVADNYGVFSLVGLRWAIKKDLVYTVGAKYSIEVGYKAQPRTVDYGDSKELRDAMFEKICSALNASKVVTP